jgi:hypothetical protein
MYQTAHKDYEITSVFRIPEMGTIKPAAPYSRPKFIRYSLAEIHLRTAAYYSLAAKSAPSPPSDR